MKRILVVEGNLQEENQGFKDGGIKTHTESLKDSISHFTDKLDIDVANPSSDQNIFDTVKDLNKYGYHVIKNFISENCDEIFT